MPRVSRDMPTQSPATLPPIKTAAARAHASLLAPVFGPSKPTVTPPRAPLPAPRMETVTKKRRNRKPWRVRAELEIKKQARSTELALPVASFRRVVREITQGVTPNEMRMTKSALEALQEAAEARIVEVMWKGNAARGHRGADTLTAGDVAFAANLM